MLIHNYVVEIYGLEECSHPMFLLKRTPKVCFEFPVIIEWNYNMFCDYGGVSDLMCNDHLRPVLTI